MIAHISRYTTFFIFFCLLAPSDILSQNLMMGTIQFPNSISKVPDIRIYRSGRKILCETDEDSKKITLSIPREPREESFYLLVSEGVQYHQVEPEDDGDIQNTISYFRVPKGQEYTLYHLTLVREEQEQSDEPLQSYKHLFEKDAAQHFGKKRKSNTPKYTWKVAQESLPAHSGQLPDDTIIVHYMPKLIESISGGSKFELPTIKMKNNLLQLVGSEKELHELSDSLLLSCLDLEPLHKTVQQQVRFGKLHTLVAPTA